jgi:hypothetical protein
MLRALSPDGRASPHRAKVSATTSASLQTRPRHVGLAGSPLGAGPSPRLRGLGHGGGGASQSGGLSPGDRCCCEYPTSLPGPVTPVGPDTPSGTTARVSPAAPRNGLNAVPRSVGASAQLRGSANRSKSAVAPPLSQTGALMARLGILGGAPGGSELLRTRAGGDGATPPCPAQTAVARRSSPCRCEGIVTGSGGCDCRQPSPRPDGCCCCVRRLCVAYDQDTHVKGGMSGDELPLRFWVDFQMLRGFPEHTGRCGVEWLEGASLQPNHPRGQWGSWRTGGWNDADKQFANNPGGDQLAFNQAQERHCRQERSGQETARDTRGTFELRDQPGVLGLPVIGFLQAAQRGLAPFHAAIFVRFQSSCPQANPLFLRQCPSCCFLALVTYGATVSVMVRGPVCGPECDREPDIPLSVRVAPVPPAGPLAAPHWYIPAWDRILEGSLNGRYGPLRQIHAGPPGLGVTRPMCAAADE